MIELITLLLTIIYGAFCWYTKEERQAERERYERDKELVEQDSLAIGKRLHNLKQRLRVHLKKKGKNHGASR
jgi:hypothetical protein